MTIKAFLDYLLNSEAVFIALMGAILFGSFLAIFIWSVKRQEAKDIYGDGEDEYRATEEKNAKIIARSTAQHPVYPVAMINMIVFELSDGSRIGLAIKDPNTYAIMVEGDCGTLKYQGKKFVSFEKIA